MKEILLILIGKGQGQLSPQFYQQYRQTRYFLNDSKKPNIETPFVGEALVTLYPKRFVKVHIFGTREAMWGTLFLHCCTKVKDFYRPVHEKVLYELAQSDEEGNTKAPAITKENRKEIESAFQYLTGIPCQTHLIPTEPTDNNLWQILSVAIKEINLKNQTVSIDMTHSFRCHPIFLFLTMTFFQTFSLSSSIGSIFYGAFELSKKVRDISHTPIYDLKPFASMMQWIQATTSFARYGDTEPIASLMEKVNAHELKKTMHNFANSIQLNLLNSIKKDAKQLITAFENVSDLPVPLLLFKEQILDFPKKLAKQSKDWKILLLIARYHFDHNRMGLFTLAASEAIYLRIADVYKIDPQKIKSKNYNLGTIASSKKIDQLLEVKISTHIRQLLQMRNRVAHGGDFLPIKAKDLGNILNLLEKHLGKDNLYALPDLIKLHIREK